MMRLKIKIYVKDELLSLIYVTKSNILETTNKSNTVTKLSGDLTKLQLHSVCSGDFSSYTIKKCHSIKLPYFIIDGVFLQIFVNELKLSHNYRQNILNTYTSYQNERSHPKTIFLKICLKPRDKEFIDYKWNQYINFMIRERCELDNTMSWLSTLGGAFSALGDEFYNCADIAGKISIHQFQLGLRLGDPFTVARCKLYLSLSLIQTQKYKLAKRLILQQYELAKSCILVDSRLIKMCRGIWSKMIYEKKIKKQGKLLQKGLMRRLE